MAEQLTLPHLDEASVQAQRAPRRAERDTPPLLLKPVSYDKSPYYLYRYIPLSYGSITIFAIFGRD